ncbi:rRNA pseudouridine synthase [Candidatus Babeliales bacterium]|nr:rRNA pseudouridine synthase [Candidatus Babeliales bacterium]
METNQKTQLTKYLAHCGLSSRRKVTDLINEGLIAINGAIVKNPGERINPTDTITCQGRVVRPEKKVYILLNKPEGFVCTLSDPNQERTVMELVQLPSKQRIYPVGRLDQDTTGVLIMTNDGDLAQQLAHPRFARKKVYHTLLDRDLDPRDLEKIRNGITLRDGKVKADRAYFVQGRTKRHVGVELHSGRYHIIRRIFMHLGYHVTKLDRVAYSSLTKRGVTKGNWRYLTQEEIRMLQAPEVKYVPTKRIAKNSK